MWKTWHGHKFIVIWKNAIDFTRKPECDLDLHDVELLLRDVALLPQLLNRVTNHSSASPHSSGHCWWHCCPSALPVLSVGWDAGYVEATLGVPAFAELSKTSLRPFAAIMYTQAAQQALSAGLSACCWWCSEWLLEL